MCMYADHIALLWACTALESIDILIELNWSIPFIVIRFDGEFAATRAASTLHTQSPRLLWDLSGTRGLACVPLFLHRCSQ